MKFQKALQKQNYKLAWQCISEDAKKKWQDFETFKEHSDLHIFDEGKSGLLQAEIVMSDPMGNVTFLIIKTSNLARVELVKEKGKWKIRDMVRVKESTRIVTAMFLNRQRRDFRTLNEPGVRARCGELRLHSIYVALCLNCSLSPLVLSIIGKYFS